MSAITWQATSCDLQVIISKGFVTIKLLAKALGGQVRLAGNFPSPAIVLRALHSLTGGVLCNEIVAAHGGAKPRRSLYHALNEPGHRDPRPNTLFRRLLRRERHRSQRRARHFLWVPRAQ